MGDLIGICVRTDKDFNGRKMTKGRTIGVNKCSCSTPRCSSIRSDRGTTTKGQLVERESRKLKSLRVKLLFGRGDEQNQ